MTYCEICEAWQGCDMQRHRFADVDRMQRAGPKIRAEDRDGLPMICTVCNAKWIRWSADAYTLMELWELDKPRLTAKLPESI